MKHLNRKLIIFLTALPLSFPAIATAEESPIEIEIYTEISNNGSESRVIDIVALDDIIVKDIRVNRGNCNLALKQLGMFNMQFPAKLSYGQTTTVVTTGKTFMEPCKNVLEVEVVTNKGNWKVNP